MQADWTERKVSTFLKKTFLRSSAPSVCGFPPSAFSLALAERCSREPHVPPSLLPGLHDDDDHNDDNDNDCAHTTSYPLHAKNENKEAKTFHVNTKKSDISRLTISRLTG
eukprot:TRINITY_DN890_c0_g1_i2.p2 TRINITY_DN890_c0_g1~~TRINITY_DN890_c0_g1_i2.p2  ORF type:complete len:110 (+),score=4.49 TRINITY_DN890_c0_g1_i2:1277-1606(+)